VGSGQWAAGSVAGGGAIDDEQAGAGVPILETTRLRLRAPRLDDAAHQHAYAREPEVAEPGMWAPLATLEENRRDLVETLERLACGEAIEWGIEHRDERRLIGRCGFVRPRPAHRSAELGYALARPYWGCGYMGEALAAVLAYGFERLALHRVEAICLADNAGSIRVLDKAGFRHEGTAREAYLLHAPTTTCGGTRSCDASGSRHGSAPVSLGTTVTTSSLRPMSDSLIMLYPR